MTEYNLRPPTRFWFEGDERAAKGYIPRARHLLSHMIRQMEMGDVETLDWHYREEGVYYELHKFGDQHTVLIRVEPDVPSPPDEEPRQPIELAYQQEIPPAPTVQPSKSEPVVPVTPQPEILEQVPRIRMPEEVPLVPEEPKREPIKIISRVVKGHVYLDMNRDGKEGDEGEGELKDEVVEGVWVNLEPKEGGDSFRGKTDRNGDFEIALEDIVLVGMSDVISEEVFTLTIERGTIIPEDYELSEGELPMEVTFGEEEIDAAISSYDFDYFDTAEEDVGKFGFKPTSLSEYLWVGAKINPIPFDKAEWGAVGVKYAGWLESTTSRTTYLAEYAGGSRHIYLGGDIKGGRNGISKETITENAAVNSIHACPPYLTLSLYDPENNVATSQLGIYSTSWESNPDFDDPRVTFIKEIKEQTSPGGGKVYQFTRSKGYDGAMLYPAGDMIMDLVPDPSGDFQDTNGNRWGPSGTSYPAPHNIGSYQLIGGNEPPEIYFEPAKMEITTIEGGTPSSYTVGAHGQMMENGTGGHYSGGPLVYRKDKEPNCQVFAVVDSSDPEKSASDFYYPVPAITGAEEVLPESAAVKASNSGSTTGGITKRVTYAGIVAGGSMNRIITEHYILPNNSPAVYRVPSGVTLTGADPDAYGYANEDTRNTESAFISNTSISSETWVNVAKDGTVARDKSHQSEAEFKQGVYIVLIDIHPPPIPYKD